MDSKTTGIVSYLTIIGWIVAVAAGDQSPYSKFHINQSLVLLIGLFITYFVTWIPFFGGILAWGLRVFLFVLWIIAFIGACQGQEKEAPLIGSIKIMK